MHAPRSQGLKPQEWLTLSAGPSARGDSIWQMAASSRSLSAAECLSGQLPITGNNRSPRHQNMCMMCSQLEISFLPSGCCDQYIRQQAFGTGEATTAPSLSGGSLSLRGGAGHGEEAMPLQSTAEEGSRLSPSIGEHDTIEVCPCNHCRADPI